MLATWRRGAACAIHDHGGTGGVVVVLAGSVVETPFTWDAEHGLLPGEPIVGRVTAVLPEANRDTRTLRLRIEALSWAWSGADTLVLSFTLTAGAFATSMLQCLAYLDEEQFHALSAEQ